MSGRRASRQTTWTKAAIVLGLVAAALAVTWVLRPGRTQEVRECQAKCSPRSGTMVPDPRFKNTYKPGAYMGPYVCSCS